MSTDAMNMSAVLCLVAALLGSAFSIDQKIESAYFPYDSSALMQTLVSGQDLAARCTSLIVGIQSAAWAASHV